jgi:type IV secretory pathway VirD2 relaxase
VRGGDRKAASSHLNAHFKYIEHRPRNPAHEQRDDRRLFSKDQDVVNRREAVDDVMEHTSARVSYHQIVLSPAEDEPVWDWRQWTRDVMADLEEAQGKELHWYAAYHQNTDNPHVHVVVAGAGYDWETGERETVKLSRQDYE